MTTVEGIIGDLLLQHNCVIVPSFGGFVAQRVGARIDFQDGTLSPPKKALLFNRQLINNDGLLIASFARQNKLDYETAAEAVKVAVLQWEQDLHTGLRISIDRVGFLYVDQERNLCFEQDKFYNLLLESYGLSAIRFVTNEDVVARESHSAVQELIKEAEIVEAPIVAFQVPYVEAPQEDVSRQVVQETIDSEEAPIISIRTPKLSKKRKYTIAAALAPLAFYTLWIPMRTDVLESGVLSIRDFNPFHQSGTGVYVPAPTRYTPVKRVAKSQLKNAPDGIAAFPISIDDDGFIPVRLYDGETKVVQKRVIDKLAPIVSESVNSADKELAAKESKDARAKKTEKVVVKEQPTVEKTVVATKKSYIIVGSFSNEANAQDVINMLKANGITAEVLNGSGLGVRVSAGDGSQIKTLTPKLTSLGLAPWLMK